MVVKYSKVFTVTGPINHKPVTIHVEYFEADSFKGVSIESLDGEYASSEAFNEAYRSVLKKTGIDEVKIYNFLPMTLPDAHQLMDTLKDAIAASKES